MSGLYFQVVENEIILGSLRIIPGRQGSLPDSPPLGHHHLELPGRDGLVERSVSLRQDRGQRQALLRGGEGEAGESPGEGSGDLVEARRSGKARSGLRIK